jgi:ABC-2 type transport system permease protein
MNRVATITTRELASYFTTPLAYVFLVIFLVLNGVCTFYLGGLFERGQAELTPFFDFHPWLYLLLVPAVSMNSWAEERRTGTLELLLTLPVSVGQAVIGKFLAGWIMIAIALALTVPIWITVNYLGSPDNGVIVANYLGSWLMAGAYLALGCCLSAATRSQVVAFVLTATLGFLLLIVGLPQVLVAFRGMVASPVIDAIAAMSYQTHFQSIGRGVLEIRDLAFFTVQIAGWLVATGLMIELKKT